MSRDFNAEARALPVLEFDRLMHGYMLRTFDPWIHGDTALELGVFHGEFTGRLFERFKDLAAVEASQECIVAAKSKWPLVEFIHSTFETVEINRQFDNVFLLHTLEHLDNPSLVLQRAREWLAPGGKLFIAVPNATAASRQIAVRMGLVQHPEAVTAAERLHGHRRTYTLDTLKLAVWHGGLEVVASGGIVFKALANVQMDRALQAGIIDKAYLDGCFEFGKKHPDLCASIYVVCGRQP